jgi:hypothetical protein
MANKNIKISDQQWLDAGMKKGYIIPDENGKPVLKKEAIAPLAAAGIGAAIPALWEGGKWLWNKTTGDKSLGEVFSGYNVDPARYQVAQKTYMALIPILDSIAGMSPRTTLAVQEAKEMLNNKMAEMANQVGIAGGGFGIKGQQMLGEEAEKQKAELERINREKAQYEALMKGPGGQPPKDMQFRMQGALGGTPKGPPTPPGTPAPSGG